MEERFVIKRKEFKKLERYAENIYSTAVVIDYFCSSQKEYEELYNLSPVVKISVVMQTKLMHFLLIILKA